MTLNEIPPHVPDAGRAQMSQETYLKTEDQAGFQRIDLGASASSGYMGIKSIARPGPYDQQEIE